MVNFMSRTKYDEIYLHINYLHINYLHIIYPHKVLYALKNANFVKEKTAWPTIIEWLI